MKELDDHFIKEFHRLILEWFSKNGRDFPWRRTSNPYSILILEKLLQQTSVRASIIDIYYLFQQKFPTISSLAVADVNQVRELIEPLGLHYRAQELIQMAQEIQNNFEGSIPQDLTSLLSIFGIGDYTARAVLCFAFDQNFPVVDTNIARILFRVLDITGKFPANPSRNRMLLEIMEQLVANGASKAINWGLIDLGSLICKSTNPICKQCPLNSLCAYNLRNISKGIEDVA